MPPLYCPECKAVFVDKEQLTIHLCSASHFDCLSYPCGECSDRFATHRHLRDHYLEAHGLTRQPLIRDETEEMKRRRGRVNAMVDWAERCQSGEVGDLDNATVVTYETYGGNTMTAPPGFTRPAFMRPFPQLTMQATFASQHSASTAQPQEGGRMRRLGATNPQMVAPVPAPDEIGDEGGFDEDGGAPTIPNMIVQPVPHPQVAAPRPVPIQQQMRATQQMAVSGGEGERECQLCHSRVPDRYPLLREHVFGHADNLAKSAPKNLQEQLKDSMGEFFPGSPVLNDMTCNGPDCWGALEGSIAHAKHLQSIHVQQHHLPREGLALLCPVDGCAFHEQLQPNVKALKNHMKHDHGGVKRLGVEVKRQLDEMVARAEDMTAGVRRHYFPFTPTCRRGGEKDGMDGR